MRYIYKNTHLPFWLYDNNKRIDDCWMDKMPIGMRKGGVELIKTNSGNMSVRVKRNTNYARVMTFLDEKSSC